MAEKHHSETACRRESINSGVRGHGIGLCAVQNRSIITLPPQLRVRRSPFGRESPPGVSDRPEQFSPSERRRSGRRAHIVRPGVTLWIKPVVRHRLAILCSSMGVVVLSSRLELLERGAQGLHCQLSLRTVRVHDQVACKSVLQRSAAVACTVPFASERSRRTPLRKTDNLWPDCARIRVAFAAGTLPR